MDLGKLPVNCVLFAQPKENEYLHHVRGHNSIHNELAEMLLLLLGSANGISEIRKHVLLEKFPSNIDTVLLSGTLSRIHLHQEGILLYQGGIGYPRMIDFEHTDKGLKNIRQLADGFQSRYLYEILCLPS